MGDAPSPDPSGMLSLAVEWRVEKMWPREEDRRRVREELLRYGRESYESGSERVRLAILKISGDDVEAVRVNVDTAKRDYRDVLVWAEYPGQWKAEWSRRPDLSPADQERLAEIRRLDREQYEAWLRSSES